MTNDRMALFLAGMGIGVAAAILMAPASGEETRRKIKKSASDAADMVQDRAKALKTSVTETVADAKQRINDTLQKGRAVVEKGLDTADSAVAKTRDVTHKVGVQVEQVGKQMQAV
jgi:gas vesicle protein